MATLKDLRVRINSVKSTRKITSAMKVVAAAKLRRAQEQALAARPYAEKLEGVLSNLVAASDGDLRTISPLLGGTGQQENITLVLVSGERGLCGGFNASVARQARQLIRLWLAQRKTVKIICVGKKARDLLVRDYGRLMVKSIRQTGKSVRYEDAKDVALYLEQGVHAGEIDKVYVLYNRFQSVISQVVTQQQLVPVPIPANQETTVLPYLYEPAAPKLLASLAPKNLAVQLYRAFLESMASEQAARTTAMDNATRNANDMIGRLSLTYNRTRQAMITKELIEIISGAEAV